MIFARRAGSEPRALSQTLMLLGVGSFVVGWGLQFLGHVWEGRKPAFLDDIRSLLIGPLFVVAECAFALGLMQALRIQIRNCD